MSHKQQTLEEFSREAAKLMGEGPPAEERLRHKDAILRNAVAASRRSRSVGHGWRIGFVAAASVAAILIGIFFWQSGPRPVDYWVGNEQVASRSGRWIKAMADHPLQVRFENGDNLELTSNSAVRINESNSEKISVVLDSGRLTARVNEQADARFSVKAGPYWIYDIGTVFSVDWSPERLALEVRVDEGLVQIVGGVLPEEGVRVTAGGTYKYPPVDDSSEMAAAQAKAKSLQDESASEDLGDQASPLLEEQPSEPPAASPDQGDRRRVTRRSRRAEPMPEAQAPSFKELPETPLEPWAQYLSRGEFSKALAAAKDDGLAAVARKVSNEDLWQLAQAARYARDGTSAGQLLRQYRERFGKSANAKFAAFLIGRVELELLGSPSRSVRWFETYLKESPGGDFAEEALGRLMQVHGRLGETLEEERAAKLYLQKYQNGLYKRLASSILNE